MSLPTRPRGPSDKSRTAALALAAVLGIFGAHRFYVGKPGTAFLMLVTLGGLGLWWLFDLVLVAAGGFTDADGRLVMDWDPSTANQYEQRDLEGVFEELDRLRLEVGDLAERLDFTERLLSQPADAGRRG